MGFQALCDLAIDDASAPPSHPHILTSFPKDCPSHTQSIFLISAMTVSL